MYMYACICMHVLCMYVCMYMYIYICICMYVCVYVCGYVCMCMCVYAYMYMYVCIIYWGNCPGEMSYPKREGELSEGIVREKYNNWRVSTSKFNLINFFGNIFNNHFKIRTKINKIRFGANTLGARGTCLICLPS